MNGTFFALLTFSGLWLMQVAIPGPNFARVSEATFTHSRALGMKTAAGTAAANMSWCVIALAGAAAVMDDPLFGPSLRLAGALYFGAYGCRLVYRSFQPRPIAAAALDSAAAFRSGYLTGLASPQAGLFFASALTTIIAPALDWTVGLAVVAIAPAVTLAWYAVVTSLLAAPLARAWYERRRPLIERALGLLLLAASVKLIGAALATGRIATP
ncbi:LysE family translocator [Sphingopyxis kveilinensis]|uniref:LysE family translocator n=1 Tax=Sphingopyxis kveilinensis TaxID=3114367 RepID=UPI0030D0A46E